MSAGRDLGASGQAAQEMGHGGPGGYAFSATSDADFVDAVATRREVGADMVTPTDFGTWGGAIAFNMNPLAEFYFGESEAGISPHQVDFLSVALHELCHVLGVGIAESWQAYVDTGTVEFLGPASRSAYGGDVPLQPDLVHWQEGITSDGWLTLMDPTILRGMRDLPTTLDMAGLYDVGWEVAGRDFPPKPLLFPEEDGEVTCDLGQLAPGASTTVTITVKPTVPDAAVNTASVSHGGDDLISWNNTVVTTTSAGVASVDADEDGVLDGVEDAGPAGGDADGDGTADRLQNAVASLPNAADGTYVTLELTGPGAFRDVRTLENPAARSSPAGVDFPIEFVTFVVETSSPGDVTTVTIDLPAGTSPTTYYRFRPHARSACRPLVRVPLRRHDRRGDSRRSDRAAPGRRTARRRRSDGQWRDRRCGGSRHCRGVGPFRFDRHRPTGAEPGDSRTRPHLPVHSHEPRFTSGDRRHANGNLPGDFQFVSATTTDGDLHPSRRGGHLRCGHARRRLRRDQ